VNYGIWRFWLAVGVLVLLVPMGAGPSFALTIDEFAASGGVSIAAGPDGALWFTALQQIGRITTDGVVTMYTIPTPNANAFYITAGPDGALWFTENASNKIGRITTTGTFTEFALASHTGPYGITVGPDNALWFTEFTANQIGRITTDGVITTFGGLTSASGASCEPREITAGRMAISGSVNSAAVCSGVSRSPERSPSSPCRAGIRTASPRSRETSGSRYPGV
jgi:streptogramin lyase